MSKLAYKLILAITVCTLTVALIVGGISLYSTTSIMNNEIENKLLMGTEKYANKFSAIFNRMEAIVDAVSADITVTFDGEAYKKDHGYVENYKVYMNAIIKQTLKETQVAQGLYLTFNPKLHNPGDEVWYARNNGKIAYVDAGAASEKRDFSLPPKKDMLHFFKPIWEKKGAWVPPYYDQDIGLNMLSYSRAVYYEDLLIGVVGADVLTKETTDIVSSMKLYPSGYAFLLDENMEFVVHPTYAAGEKMEDICKKEALHFLERMKKEKSGTIRYSLHGERKIMGFSHLDNGWILAITQPNTEVFAPIKRLQQIMVVLGTMIVFATVIFAFVFARAFSKPIVREKGELEERNREKDIMLTYQSRQAKMGEMVGNIAHQWKQPLNSINLILVNILDAYRYGELNEEKLKNSIAKADRIVKKLVETVADFTEFLKPSKEQMKFDVNESIE
ncbi:MAG: Cache 3/Cache 2 fusion domain-containing protein, partial [Anaerovorax sp.]